MIGCTLDDLRDRLNRSDGKSAFDRICHTLSRYEKVCVFGMGNYGQEILPYIKEQLGDRLVCVSDNDTQKHNREFSGLRCVHPDEMEAFKEDIQIFVSIYMPDAIVNELMEKGFSVVNRSLKRDEALAYRNMQAGKLYAENISSLESVFSLLADDLSKEVFLHRLRYNLFPEDFAEHKEPFSEVYSGDQYFPKDIIQLAKEEVFVDCGAFDGDTISLFLARTANGFRHISGFELDGANFTKLSNYVKSLPSSISGRISLYQCGVWNRSEDVVISGTQSGAHISGEWSDSEDRAQLIALDNMEFPDSVSFIKMDVEGCEQNALRGCENIIKANRPKLAVCVYHYPEDVYEIPLLIHELNPDYKLYFRHHSRDWWYANETVCYAV